MVVVLILMITTVWNDYLVGLIFGGIGAQADDGDPRQLGRHLARRGRSTTSTWRRRCSPRSRRSSSISRSDKFFVQGITSGAIKG